MTSLFKPMLAATITDLTTLTYPLLASQKLDGIRATMQNHTLYSRKLKPIPNIYIQRLFRNLPDGLDGELIVGDPTSPTCYRDTMSLVMSDDKPLTFFSPKQIAYHVFDRFDSTYGFTDRLLNACQAIASYDSTIYVPHTVIVNQSQLILYEEEALSRGAEGIMLRDTRGRYKQGRSTLREGWLMKLKRFLDTDARIVSCFELEHNNNPATVNELGRTHRSSHQANKVPLNTLGGFIVEGLSSPYKEVQFRVGTGFDQFTRDKLWKMRSSLRGKIIKVKYLPHGAKDKPRHPVWLGFRDPRDL
jgi:DNA ligase 1